MAVLRWNVHGVLEWWNRRGASSKAARFVRLNLQISCFSIFQK